MEACYIGIIEDVAWRCETDMLRRGALGAALNYIRTRAQ